jgi:hypothetical protein
MKILPVIIFSILLFPTITFASTNINVPFTSQAPYSNWSEPWENACEEATIVMVDAFYANKYDRTIHKAEAKLKLEQTFTYKHITLGWSLDENADTIIFLINNFFKWEAYKKINPTISDLKAEIDAGHPIILPSYGKALKNPYFHNGGPPYHTIVLSGYDDDKNMFITQEPGTRHGLDFRYSYDTIINAMHDFVQNDTQNGERVAIFTRELSDKSSNLDWDKDGLGKADEFIYHTNLLKPDTDDDGYADGIEVKNGFSPIIAEKKLQNGSLVKDPNSPSVYFIEHGKKRPIKNEKAFLSRGWSWSNIVTVSSSFLKKFTVGEFLK